MIYLALGDSISIDDYTGVEGGGAASQLARLVGVEPFVNLTSDGNTTEGVLRVLETVHVAPDLITLTAGGNDFLMAAFWGANPETEEGVEELVEKPLRNLAVVANRLAVHGCPVILNTIYDPTDGDDGMANQLGLLPSFRPAYNRLNEGIRALAYHHGFLLSDLEPLFRGHGIPAADSWIVRGIEPNLPGATAIARHWHTLFVDPRYPCPCCRRLTLTAPPPGSYDICDRCGWEDDAIQFDNPDFAGGANHLSLRQAQGQYMARCNCG